MIKAIKIINYVLIAVVTLVLTYFKDSFDCTEKILSLFIGVLNIIIAFICKEYETLYGKFESKKELLKNKDKEIDKLNLKISELLININENSPYYIQEYIKESSDNTLKKGEKYDFNIVVSTVSKEYKIKYINLICNNKINLNQTRKNEINSYYKLNNRIPQNRNGKYEYSFIAKNDERLQSVAMCEFEICYNNEKDVEMVIVVMGESLAIDKKKTVKLKFID